MDTQVNPVKKTGLQIWFTNKYKGASGTDLKSFLNRTDNKSWILSATLKHTMPPGKTSETLSHEVVWSTYTVLPASLHPNCTAHCWLSGPLPYLVRVGVSLHSLDNTSSLVYSPSSRHLREFASGLSMSAKSPRVYSHSSVLSPKPKMQKNVAHKGLDRWLSGQEHLLLFKKTLVWFLASNSGRSWSIITQGNLMLYSDLLRYLCIGCVHT